MAQLGFAVVGALIGGSTYGAAIGLTASSGWLIGSIIGTLLFPPPGPVTEGPRLGDLTVMSSAYGMPIPIIYGTIRVAGNMIWSTGIDEVRNKKKSGGKGLGGGGSTSITYEYFATFAIGLCEGVADDVLRIWADGKLIYDKTTTDDDIIKAGLEFRFYDGNEAQEPDSAIEADKGVDETPAYRGLCYLVFDNLPLKDFANRIPSLTVEVTFDADPAQPVVNADLLTLAEGGISASVAPLLMVEDFKRGVFYATGWNTDTTFRNVLRRFNRRTMVEDRQSSLAEDLLMNGISKLEIQTILPNGFIVVTISTTSGVNPISLINPDSLEIVASNTGFDTPDSRKVNYIEVSTIRGPQYYYFMGSRTTVKAALFRMTETSIDYVWDSGDFPILSSPSRLQDNAGSLLSFCSGAVGEGFGEGYIIAADSAASDTNIRIYKVIVSADATFWDLDDDTVTGVDLKLLATFTPGQLVPGVTDLRTAIPGPALGLVYDTTDDTIMFGVNPDPSSGGGHYLVKFNPATGTILWSTLVPSEASGRGGPVGSSRVDGGVWGQMMQGNGWAVRTTTGELFYDETGWDPAAATGGGGWWDSRTSSVIGFNFIDPTVITKWLFFRGSGAGVGLDTVVADLSQRSGLAPSDINVTDLASEIVPGYTVGRPMPARSAIQPLSSVYYFDGVESDYVLKYLLRAGKSTEATIPEQDLAVLDNNTGEFFRESRTQEVELPMRYTLTYMDKDNDYLQAAHSAKRILGPGASMNSRNEVGLQVAIALGTDFAKQATEKALFSSWIERSSYVIQLSWEYLALDPSDLVNINLDDGASFRTRLIQTEVGVGLSIDVSALSEDAAQYTSAVLSDGGNSGLIQTFLSNTATKLILLCSPLLRDSDDVGRVASTLYFIMGGFGQPGWSTGTLFKSVEGTEYNAAGVIVSEMAWGAASNALGDVVYPFQTDEANSLTVFMTTGADELSSVTQIEMVNGANPAALIHANGVDVEIIQFRDVTVNADSSLTLSGLLRGRRGTEVFTGNHTAGDIFVLLNSSDVETLSLSLGERDQTRFYKAIVSGLRFEDVSASIKASPANDLKPYAVVNHTATLGVADVIDFTWERRTRVSGDLQDGSGNVPISEDVEEYELEIFDGPGGTEVREVTGLTSPAFSYTSGDQTTDGFTPPLSTITIRVYQISAQVGRGFSQEVTLDVQ